jgi:hypothetical protein
MADKYVALFTPLQGKNITGIADDIKGFVIREFRIPYGTGYIGIPT